MLKFLILLALTIAIFIQTGPAYCGSRTMTLVVSAILPEHVMSPSDLNVILFSNNPNQLVQTQTVIRNNRSILLTSIVVP